ncbi:MAG: hypothetical protein ABRQ37_11765 [Candidatus Eremiobacterota bacterium]
MPVSNPIIFKADPTKDIVNKEEKYFFGEMALVASVGVSRISGSGMESSCSKSSPIGVETIDGIKVCRGVNYCYSIKSQQTATYATGIGIPFGGTVVTGVTEGEIHVQVSWETYTPPPDEEEYETTTEPPSTPYTEAIEAPPPDADSNYDSTQEYETVTEKIPKTIEEWTEQQTVWREGFNWKCINEYSTIDLQHGEERADSDIVNNIIPNDDTAKRVGELAVGESERNENIGINTVANWDIKLGDLAEIEISLLNKQSVERIIDIEILNASGGEQHVIMNCRGRE